MSNTRFRMYPRICPQCGTEFLSRFTDNRPRYCSHSCYDVSRRGSETPCKGCSGPLGQSNQTGYCRKCSMAINAIKHIRRGEENHSWKGGKIVDERGYVKIRVSGKYRREHRVVAECMLGR